MVTNREVLALNNLLREVFPDEILYGESNAFLPTGRDRHQKCALPSMSAAAHPVSADALSAEFVRSIFRVIFRIVITTNDFPTPSRPSM